VREVFLVMLQLRLEAVVSSNNSNHARRMHISSFVGLQLRFFGRPVHPQTGKWMWSKLLTEASEVASRAWIIQPQRRLTVLSRGAVM
jgi:hypothetical protein